MDCLCLDFPIGFCFYLEHDGLCLLEEEESRVNLLFVVMIDDDG